MVEFEACIFVSFAADVLSGMGPRKYHLIKIIISKYSIRVSNLISKSSVQVLATLFYLSFIDSDRCDQFLQHFRKKNVI